VAERHPAFFTGAALMVVFSTVTSLVQLIAPNEMRGRVDEHLHARVPRWDAARQPRQRVSRDLSRRAAGHRINGGLLVGVAIYFLTRKSWGARRVKTL